MGRMRIPRSVSLPGRTGEEDGTGTDAGTDAVSRQGRTEV